MGKKLSLVFISLLLVSTTLTSCSAGDSITSIPPLSLEEVEGSRLVNLSNEEKEGIVYKYVTDRIIVDQANLIGVSDKDTKAINTLFSQVNEALKGKNNGALSDEYANYLLMEFAKTPYEWEQSRVDIIGFDPSARLYFVDVVYNTTSTLKQVVPDSSIVAGSPDEELLKQKRYNDYITYLSALSTSNPEAPNLLTKFEASWGKVSDIKDAQNGVSLLERTRSSSTGAGGIGRLTYTGLISDSKLNKSATMTIRYVLKYNFNLGEETDLAVNSLYLKDYKLGNPNTILSGYSLLDPTGVEVLKPFIDQLITSYQKAVEESNDIGLYQLFYDYSKWDKYYEAVDNYSLVSSGNYEYEILSREGTNVVVKVDRQHKNRAKGTEMSLPNYQETLIMNLVLCNDDTIRIKSVQPLTIELIGEPLSVVKDITGISETIQYSDSSFTESNRVAVEEAIKDFSKKVINGISDSNEIYDVVDLGVAKSTVKRMIETMNSIDAQRKTTWVVNYINKTNVYCSVTLREVFETGSNNYDTEAVIDLVNRDGEWKVVDYTRSLSVKTSAANVDASTALCQDVRE
jgi:hypothetical protein